MTDILASPRHELLASPIHPSQLQDLTFSPIASHGAHSDDFPTFDIDTLLSALKTPPPGVRTSHLAFSPIMPAFDTLPSPPRDPSGPSGPSDGERCPNCQKFEREETGRVQRKVKIECELILLIDQLRATLSVSAVVSYSLAIARSQALLSGSVRRTLDRA
jgi:hypothetical protein